MESYVAIEKRRDKKWAERSRVGGENRENSEIQWLRQNMESMDREKAPAYPPLQKRKWSVQRRQSSKPLPNTAQWIHLMCVERRSASFVLHRDKGVLHVTRDRRMGGAQKGMKDETVSDGKHEGWSYLCVPVSSRHTHTQVTEGNTFDCQTGASHECLILFPALNIKRWPSSVKNYTVSWHPVNPFLPRSLFKDE